MEFVVTNISGNAGQDYAAVTFTQQGQQNGWPQSTFTLHTSIAEAADYNVGSVYTMTLAPLASGTTKPAAAAPAKPQ